MLSVGEKQGSIVSSLKPMCKVPGHSSFLIVCGVGVVEDKKGVGVGGWRIRRGWGGVL
jgi:hypothetical protein